MDTSAEYILMCTMAEKAAPETFYRDHFTRHDFTFKVEGNDLMWWLPTQSQLQEMLKGNIASLLFRVQRQFNEMQFPDLPTSMEQLWLALVMKEKHGKVWTGTEWASDLSVKGKDMEG